jgi:predicted transcriptional regulator
MARVKENYIIQVKRALENPASTWRTVSGIAEETGLDAQTIRDIIAAIEAEIIRSKVPAPDGEDLYTTRSQLKPMVFKALKNPRLKWRSILGLATDTGLDVGTIEDVLAKSGKQIIKAKERSAEGFELYQTRSD